MHLISVQIGAPRVVQVGKRHVETGIDKQTVPSAVITHAGVDGDHVVDTRHHGGPDQAIYLYSAEDHDWWEGELGRPVRPGEFGENLTVSSFGADEPRVGHRYQVGEQVTLELTAPRIPCAVLGAQMRDGRFADRLRSAGRPGAYARVIEVGTVQPGDAIELVGKIPGAPTLSEMFEVYYDRSASEEDLLRILDAPVAQRARDMYQERLAGLA